MTSHLTPLLMAGALCLLGLASAGPSVYQASQFSGKVVLVTGGSSGIGYQTVLLFARAGARVWFCSRDSNPSWFNGTTAAKDVNSDQQVVAAGGYARFVRADASNPADAERFFNAVVGYEGTLDIAVNNAGIGGPSGRFDTMWGYLRGGYDPIMNNVYGVANMLSLETRFWAKKGRDGVVVNTASKNGISGTPYGALYGASKHAIVGLTRSVALEFANKKDGPQIRVNALAPGLTATPLTFNQAKTMEDPSVQSWMGDLVTEDSALWAKYGPQWASELPNGVLARPEDQANTIAFLCSREASYISGAVFSVDFGLCAL